MRRMQFHKHVADPLDFSDKVLMYSPQEMR